MEVVGVQLDVHIQRLGGEGEDVKLLETAPLGMDEAELGQMVDAVVPLHPLRSHVSRQRINGEDD